MRQVIHSALPPLAATAATALRYASVGLFDYYLLRYKKDRVVFYDTVRE